MSITPKGKVGNPAAYETQTHLQEELLSYAAGSLTSKDLRMSLNSSWIPGFLPQGQEVGYHVYPNYRKGLFLGMICLKRVKDSDGMLKSGEVAADKIISAPVQPSSRCKAS